MNQDDELMIYARANYEAFCGGQPGESASFESLEPGVRTSWLVGALAVIAKHAERSSKEVTSGSQG